MIHAYATLKMGGQLGPFEYDSPSLESHDVEIKIDFCGLCYSDVNLIDNNWNISKYPLVPGHEIIGKVIQKGVDVSDLKIGQIVGVGWQCGACLKCPFCNRGDETVCTSKVRTCVDRYGGFADKIVVDSRFVYPIPQTLDPAKAAPLLCAGITVYTPLRLHNIQSGMSVAVIGIGGLGHLALQFARALGCEVTAISSSPDKEDEAKQLGAHHFLTLASSPKNSFDAILSTTRADLSWASIGLLLRPYGRLCFLGLPQSDIKFPPRLLVSNNLTLCGSGSGNRRLVQEMLTFAAEHKISALIEQFPLSDLNQAIERLKSNKVRYRIVLQNA